MYVQNYYSAYRIAIDQLACCYPNYAWKCGKKPYIEDIIIVISIVIKTEF